MLKTTRKLTPEQREAARQRASLWYYKNHSKAIITRRRYWNKNRRNLLEQKKEYYKNHKEDIAIKGVRYRRANKGKVATYKRNWYVANRKRVVRRMVEYNKTIPTKMNARRAVSNALRDGRLKKKPCEVCGIKKVEAHHEDYSKPLLIKWLCVKHHRERHRIYG